jgi:hypothetical protein
MEVNMFIEKMNKQKSNQGILLTSYYGTFERFREYSDKFITVQLHIPPPNVVFNLACGEREVVEKIIIVSELLLMPYVILDDYVSYILNDLHETLKEHRRME